MNRRSFLKSLFTFLTTLPFIKMPFALSAKGGIVKPGTAYVIGNGDYEHFTPATNWYNYERPITWHHAAWEFPPLSINENDKIFAELLEEFRNAKYLSTR